MGHVAQIPCGNCGTLNSASDQFCANCGYSLAGGPTGTIPALNNPNAPAVITAGRRRITGALAPGELLGGRYRNVELVGKGGFGAVYKANDERFQGRRVVAIKEMSDAHLSPQDRVQALKDFRQEANMLVQLRHPNLPDVSDFFEESGKAYLVMEFIEGKTLEKVQDDANGPLNEQLVMGWALQLCDVLNYLHTQPQPIVFRDLKPSNVMVTKNGQLKLIDFGIARIFKSTAARDTTTLGSRGYAPLEQYGRGQSDARSDIYALGATLYDLLTKTVPTDAPTRRINPPLFKNPRQLNPAISSETERIILKAMAEEPRDRYQSAAEMTRAIVASGVLPVTSPGRSYAGTPPGYTTIPAPTSMQPAPATIPANPSLSTQAATIPAAPTPSTPQTTSMSSQTIAATPPTLPKTIPAPTTPPVPAFAAQAQSAPQQQQTLVPAGPGGTPPPGIYPSYPNLTPPPGQQRITRRALLIGGLVAAGVVAGGGYAAVHFLSSPPPPNGSTIQVPFVYSTEKADWLTAAASSFSNSPLAKLTGSNKTIQVLLNDSGSLDVADKILNGEIKPVAWSPASTLELNRLAYRWKQAKGQSQDIFATSTDLAPVPLVSSPLVFAVWKDRAQVFLKKYPRIDWDYIHMALQKNGWADLGQPSWGRITLGQTRPDESNSGLLTIMLMAYDYVQKTTRQQELSINLVKDPNLWGNYIEVFENAVNEFGQSSGTYFKNTIIPEGLGHSITMTYENLVLLYQNQAQQHGGEPLQIFYPSLNGQSNHPFAILDTSTSWVTPEQQQAALQFCRFLVSPGQQREALKYGFRPTDLSVQLTDPSIPNNPFHQLAQLSPAHTFDPLKDTLAPYPHGDVVDTLISQWQLHNQNV